ncbi:MAG: pelota family protein, partial [Thermoplasmata archaeon]|nr:pelota family protein [Thermoplasmata archaeon]
MSSSINLITHMVFSPVMRVVFTDRKAGRIKVMVENPDDIWHLYSVIRRGDVVYGVAFRREEQRADMVRAVKTEKKRMWVGVRVEDVEFRAFTDKLRVAGVIVDGPQDIGRHQSLDIGPGDTVEVVMDPWRPRDAERLGKAARDTRRPKVVVVSLDDEEAVAAVLWSYGIQEAVNIRGHGGGRITGGRRMAEGGRLSTERSWPRRRGRGRRPARVLPCWWWA